MVKDQIPGAVVRIIQDQRHARIVTDKAVSAHVGPDGVKGLSGKAQVFQSKRDTGTPGAVSMPFRFYRQAAGADPLSLGIQQTPMHDGSFLTFKVTFCLLIV